MTQLLTNDVDVAVPKRRKMPTTRRLADDRKAHGRSKITNHADLLPNISHKSKMARRFRDLVNSFLADAGGRELCSEIKIGLMRRLAATTVLSENFEAQMIDGVAVDISQLCTLSSTCMRLSVRVGLERTAKPVAGLHDQGGLLDQLARETLPVVIENDESSADG
jgi:hypothetical protein